MSEATEPITPDEITSAVPAVRADRPPAVQRYYDTVSNPALDDPQAAQEAIVERILSATSVDDVLGGSELTDSETLFNTAIVVHGVKWNRSDFEESAGAYAVVEANRCDTGEKCDFSTGASNVMAQLFKLGELDAFPITVILREADRPSKAGYKPQWLEPATGDF